MKNSFLASLVTLSVLILSSLTGIEMSSAQGLQGLFYYLIPPGGVITINDEELIHEGKNEGKMVFRREDREIVTVGKNTHGARLVSKNFQADLKNEAKIEISGGLDLKAGSIHIMTLSTSTGESTIRIGDLKLTFQSADFLAFVSGDGSEKIIKVIEGEVSVENSDSEQQAILKSQEATSTDSSGKILSPSPYEPDDKSFWWGSKYEYQFQRLPIAHAGEDQRVLGNIPVVLDGSKSEFETGDIFEWELVKGPKDSDGNEVNEVAFDSTNIVKPLFTPVVEGEYHFILQITDEKGEKSNRESVIIYVGKRYLRPIAIFPDVPADHPNNLAIAYLYKKNVMRGSEDPESGKILFRPEDTINRVEILKTVFENKKQSIPTEEDLRALDTEIFKDVKTDHWFAPYVYLAKKQGIVKGNDGYYRPADDVNLVEALKIISEANQISMDIYRREGKNPYPDTEVDAWYNPYLFFVKKYNLVDLDERGNINPGDPVTRAKFAEIIYRLESINLLEKRGFVTGVLKDEKSNEGVAHAEIYVYRTVEETSEEGEDGFVKKGDLYYKSTTDQSGYFTISLPVHTKFYIEAISEDSTSSKNIIIQVEEDETSNIELKISIEEEEME